MTSDAVLATLRSCAENGVFLVSEAAIARMREGGASHSDLRNAMLHAVRCEAAEDGRWTVLGPSLDGGEMTIVVAVRERVVTIL